MRKYEVIFIVRPDVPEEAMEKLITQMDGVVAGAGGEVVRVDRLGRRKLAYRVERQREGLFVLFVVEGAGEMVKEFERRLRLSDVVIKQLTVRVDEEEKRALKAKEIRAKKEARRPKAKPATPPPPVVPPQTVAEPAQG